MSSSDPWTLQQTVLTVGCIVTVFGGALFVALRSNRKHREKLEAFAQEMEWPIVQGDTAALKAAAATAVEELFPEEQFNLPLVIEVETGSRRIVFADGTQTHRTGKRTVSLATACLVESARFPAIDTRVEVCERRWLDAQLLSNQVDMGDGDFARAFIVQSTDPASAYKVLTLDLQEVLLDRAQQPLYNPARIAIDSGRMALFTGYLVNSEYWLDLVEWARKIESVAR